MKEGVPVIVLVACAVAAGFCLIGGVLLARSEHHQRIDRSLDGHTAFVERLRKELLRLEDLYERHLSLLLEAESLRDETALRMAARRIEGIRQVTVLSRNGVRPQTWHIGERRPDEGEVPELTFDTQVSTLPERGLIRLDPAPFLDSPRTSGWIDEPGKPLYFWQRLGSRVGFILIDLPAIQVAVDGWLRGWLPEAFASVQVGEGADVVRGPGGNVLIQGGTSQTGNDRRPHVLIPAESRFGTWHLASWDRIQRDVVYQTPILWGSSGVAGLLVLLGVVAYGHQRRAMLDARRRVSFVNHVSHELRSPLTNIMLNAELAEEHADLDSRQTRECLGLIREESHRLNRLIGNVLTFSERDRGRKAAVTAPSPAADVIQEVLTQFGEALQRKGLRIELTGEGGARALVARDPLFQIVANLVSNVEKYGAAGGLLRVETETCGGRLRVRVMDRGPGIPSRERERVFEAFVRLDGRMNEGVGGTGLGLHIARNLAREMEGDLRVLPSKGGAVFELSVPCLLLTPPQFALTDTTNPRV